METFPEDVGIPKVEIHVTDVCNNRCGFCTTGWVNAERGPRLAHVPRETIRRQLETAYDQGARRALFQGGEPTVRRDLGELLGDAWDIGYVATTIFTNARMAASRAGARWLVGMRVSWFQVSIQGGTTEAHDESVLARGAFEQTVAGTRRLIALGQRVKINAVLTRHLLDSLDAFAALMIDLRPEEIGLDTVKPSGAFETGRSAYADLVPRLGDYAAALSRAVHAMDDAGLTVRLTSFPACVAPDVAGWVSEESPDTLTHQTDGTSVQKLAWKRAMQRKRPSCVSCAFDSSCGGVYAPYAELHGLDELAPLSIRPRKPARVPRAPDSPLTTALRKLFVGGSRDDVGVRSVSALSNGAHELVCFSPRGVWPLVIAPKGSPAYAETDRFGVRYERSDDRPSPDLAIVDAVVRALRRVEGRLPR